jgi:DNA-binding LacI/PurR family transcriptional regulator/DNA-binding transcriptional regulator YhcF (GntR family)
MSPITNTSPIKRKAKPAEADFDSVQPLYDRARTKIKELIAHSRLSANDQLPTVRQISADIGISRATVANAINRMIGEGLLIARQGKGIYLRKPSDSPRVVELRAVYILSPGRPSVLGLENYMAHSPFWSQILNGVRQQIETSGESIRLRFAFLPDFLDEEDATPRQRRWDDVGFILLQEPDGSELQRLLRLGRSVVQVHGISKSQALTSVSADCGAAAVRLVDHLVSLGHRRIAFCGSVTRRFRHFSLVDFEKVRGYWLGLEKNGIRLNPEMYVRDCSFGPEEGYRAIQPLLALPAPDRPTGVICGNDEIALGAMRAIREAGLSIPEDLSVAGFDNLTMGRFAYPSLTTVALHMEKMGQLAVRRLMEIHRGGDRRPTVLQPELILRESTGKAK